MRPRQAARSARDWSGIERRILDDIEAIAMGLDCSHAGIDDGECIACGQQLQKPRPTGPVWQ